LATVPQAYLKFVADFRANLALPSRSPLFQRNRRPMTERDIFLDALEREDPAVRAAYLDTACAGRPALRRRVEELLRLHRQDSQFLNTPVLEQLAASEESLPFLKPATEPNSLGGLDHYEVLEVVGGGSTGIVLNTFRPRCWPWPVAATTANANGTVYLLRVDNLLHNESASKQYEGRETNAE
jgi:hypothetical protein